MAGGSVPLAQPVPMVTWPGRWVVEEAVSIHGGALESYDFHGLELLQSLIEARRGGETGVSSVELVSGEKLQQALSAGRISHGLIEAAIPQTTGMQKAHLEDLRFRIAEALKGRTVDAGPPVVTD